MDSVVLLDVLAQLRRKHGYRLSALHVHHGLSPHAGEWASFCRTLCARLKVPLTVKRVRVARRGEGPEAAARAARYAAFRSVAGDAIVLAHHLDDQAETVLFNLLRGSGLRGLSGMPGRADLEGKVLLRPFLDLPREALHAWAVARALSWVEDESNADEALTRNFLRRRLAPLIASRFPRWREALGRVARFAARREIDASDLLRAYLRGKGLRAPSEARLAEMLRQLSGSGARTAIAHDGKVLRLYRGEVSIDAPRPSVRFEPVEWTGERSIELPGLGTLTFARVRSGFGIDPSLLKQKRFSIRLRAGGERFRPDPRRPRRTLKNLFQEAGIPPHERERLPLLFCEDDLVWVPGLGIDARFRKKGGIVPKWVS